MVDSLPSPKRRWVMLVELLVMEQRYQAVLARWSL
jgi:hypothetical protein